MKKSNSIKIAINSQAKIYDLGFGWGWGDVLYKHWVQRMEDSFILLGANNQTSTRSC